jgi:two-component system LytT family response regulator
MNKTPTLNALIIEDEPKNAILLRKMVEKYCPQVIIRGDANSIEKAIKLIKQENPDLVFLDIEIGGGNAFDLLDYLQPVEFDIIFVTAYDNYLLKAIKYSALDYLLKPININELVTAVNKSFNKVHFQKISERIDILLQNLSKKKSLPTIALPTAFGFQLIPIQNIVRCEARGSYTMIFMNDGKSNLASKTLKEYEDLLPSDIFFRAHYSHLVNIHCIAKYHKGKGGILEMTDRAMIPVASRRKNEFLNIFSPREI